MGDVPDAEKKWLQDPNGNESPPTRGIEDRVDCISYLPDNILGDIISLLPTKDDARTKVLASKWSHFWRSAPLNIDHCDLQEISNIVNTHPGLTRRFCIPVSCLRSDIDTVDALLQSATLNGPQELEFRLPDLDLKWSSYPPPPVSTFRFSSTLRVVSFGGCDLPDIIFDHLQLPNLQQLTVSNATISEGTLHAMLAGCPALEILLLKYNEGFRCLRINCPYLKSIGIHSRFSRRWKGLTLEEVLIEDAPCLERLIIFDQINRLRISVILAPKLETLGCISEYLCKTALTLGSTMFQFQGIRSVGMRAMVPMHTVKVLSISTFFLRLDDVIISFIGCFPCLEKLYIQSRSPVHRNRRCREHKNLIKTFGLHLKHIVLSNYWGTREQSEFATFFLLNARILESMKLVAPAGFYPDNDWIEEQRRELKLENSASRGAKVTFTNYACRHGLMHVFRANDLSVADPFDCSC